MLRCAEACLNTSTTALALRLTPPHSYNICSDQMVPVHLPWVHVKRAPQAQPTSQHNNAANTMRPWFSAGKYSMLHKGVSLTPLLSSRVPRPPLPQGCHAARGVCYDAILRIHFLHPNFGTKKPWSYRGRVLFSFFGIADKLVFFCDKSWMHLL